MSTCEVVTFPLVSWVRCRAWLYRFLIFAPFLTLTYALLHRLHNFHISCSKHLCRKWIIKSNVNDRQFSALTNSNLDLRSTDVIYVLTSDVGGPGLTLNNGSYLYLISVYWWLMLGFSWAHHGSPWGVL